MTSLSYADFLRAKAAIAPKFGGIVVDEAALNPALKPHTRRMVAWGLQGGRRAWFASFGLHKTATQLEATGREMHLCPLQFDIVDRVIAQFTMPGEVVLDPFGGLMTVPFRAVRAGRKGIGIELNRTYWLDGVKYCEAAERETATPSLFDFLDETGAGAAGMAAE